MAERSDSFDGAPFADELDDGEALQAAARAGILLLEQNHELQEENAALREQVAVLEQERPSLRQALEARDAELQALRDERRQAMLEANALRNEVKAQSALVTDLLERERLLKAAADDAEVARELAEASMDALQRRIDELRALSDSQSAELQVLRDGASNQLDDKAGDAAGDLEDVTAKWHAAVAENQAMQRDLESALRDGDALRRKAAKLADCVAQIERLEKKSAKLQAANETLHEELEEERAVLESLRTMNLMYKKLADSRPFAFDEDPNGLDEPAAMSHEKPAMAPPAAVPGSVTLQDVLLETNLKLETEIRELKMAMNRDHPNNNEEDGDNNSSHSNDDTLKRSGSNGSLNTASNNGSEETQEDRLMRKVQSLEEKLKVAKDVIKHAKLHWSSAVASQKALEECNRDAQDEIARLTQQLDYYVSLATSQSSDATAQKEELLKKHGDDNNPPDFEEKWVEETAPYPAPPGDLNSPLIKCLLDHWTTDKSEVMMLTDWLHNAIRGTGKSTPLHLSNLKSEVAAGFAQLLVPILRERHGVSVTIYRRDSLHILSDLLLQTNQSSYDVPEFTTSESESTNEEEASTPRTFKMKANSGRSGRAMRRKRGSSPFLKGETQFLYG